jgi:DNA-binding XRE family transcriptional regulator
MPDRTPRPDDHAPQMTQADLAQRVGVTQQTISGIEKGAAGPGDALKVRIASALSADVWDVFPLVRDEAVA